MLKVKGTVIINYEVSIDKEDISQDSMPLYDSDYLIAQAINSNLPKGYSVESDITVESTEKISNEENRLNYSQVLEFMKQFEIDYINRFDEMIIDHFTNTYVYIGGCHDIDDIVMRTVYAMARPIGKGLEESHAIRLLNKINNYFKISLTCGDMLTIYEELCYERKLPQLKKFVMNGMPMEEIMLYSKEEEK